MRILLAVSILLPLAGNVFADLSSSRAQNVVSSATTITGPGGGSLPVVSTSVYKVSADTAVITDPMGFYTIFESTVSVSSGTITIIISTNTTRVMTSVVNEGPFDIRVGRSSSISQAIGELIKNGSSINLDIPRYFRGALFAISVGTSSSKVSTLEGSP